MDIEQAFRDGVIDAKRYLEEMQRAGTQRPQAKPRVKAKKAASEAGVSDEGDEAEKPELL